MHNYLGRAKPRLQEATEIGPPLLPLPECRMCRVRAASFLCLPVSLGSRAFPSSQELGDTVPSWMSPVLITGLG